MTWLRVDDQIAYAASTITAGNSAMGAWLRMSAWSAAQLADGAIPRAVAGTMATPEELAALVRVGLLVLHEATDAYEIVGYLDTNPTRAEVLSKRADLSAKRAEAGRIGGQRSGESRRSKRQANWEAPPKQVASDVASSSRSPVPSRPVPSRPSPDPTGAAGEIAPPAPLTLTGDKPRRARREPRHTPEQTAAKDRIVEAFATAFEAAKGVKPSLDHQADHAAAFALAAKYGPDEGSAIVRRALEDSFVLENNPTLRYVASKPDAWRGKVTIKANGKAPVQRDRAFSLPGEEEGR